MRGRPGSVRSLEEFGRVRLSASFFMRDFLHSGIADFHGIRAGVGLAGILVLLVVLVWLLVDWRLGLLGVGGGGLGADRQQLARHLGRLGREKGGDPAPDASVCA